ncbi:haloacid dehalogenase-like hydrolase [Tsukamurella hominis]|uniref:haloacid dehalogenase-like hydrolase n=1 Tax=Tsukamurella hominis TaxID=1970232 RepID=UPI0039ED4561
MRRIRAAVTAAALLALAPIAACTTNDAQDTAAECRTLAPDAGWYGDNHDRLQKLIAERGHCGTGHGGAAPVALFDWDNTVVRNDIGSATAYWMIRTGKIRQPANGDWRTTSRYLVPEAAQALAEACPTALAAPGAPLPTDRDTRCADALVAVVDDAEIGGKPAFAGFDHRRMEPAYAWVVQLMAGYTEAEIEDFAKAARTEALAAPEGAKQRVGTTEVGAWVRYYSQIKDLIGTLAANGFDVRIISASAQPVVRAWAPEVGLAPDKLIGIRPVVADGKIAPHLRGCGDVPDGDDSMINYIDGKRCLVNQEVLGITGAAAWQQAPADRRQVLSAGDSVTDITFLGDATGLRLVINRNVPELMCTAYADADGKWLVNPMFIEPKPQAKPYACATAGTDAAGAKVPVRGTDGAPLGSVADTVY